MVPLATAIPTDDQPGGGTPMDVTTLLVIGLGPSVLVTLAGVMLALARTVRGSASQDPGYTGPARTRG